MMISLLYYGWMIWVFKSVYLSLTWSTFVFFVGHNSSPPSAASMRQWTGSTLLQVMACCLTAPSHYLNQWWLILWHSSGGSCGESPKLPVTKPSSEIASLKSHLDLTGDNESVNWINIASGNGLLPDGTKPLPEPMMTNPVAFIWGFMWRISKATSN